ncbi:Fanconi anemia group M protein isoform X1 [Alligator sinensis]|uniref:ATP-dependent RNA helicase FANCM n=1 Tax=Alligator sinensis TaxID=38654 RepID=A0A3Q0GTE3_ALLSI|nr:Fanconi anemia group M protein isoform X1 [Alligator sinensis]
MYNFYRWFPSGKVLFLAPTKPLVAQQMEACARLMGLSRSHMAEMTGGTQVPNRKEIWDSKRVFFLTPQIMVNDLSRGICPAGEIKCLVIDEAHRALGNYAYCQVVKELKKYTSQFRVLALSATPGSDTKAVQQVISNLLIAQIEICSEDSPDIRPYSHVRQMEKIVVPLGEELAEFQSAYIRVLETFADRLIRIKVLAQCAIPSLTKYQIILARNQFRKKLPSRNMGIQPGTIEGDFALCITLYHGYELLQQMGTRSLYMFLYGIMDGSKDKVRTRNELSRNEDFMNLYQQLENMFANTALTSANGSLYNCRTGPENKRKFIYSHPKLKKLEEVVVEHFKSWKGNSADQSVSENKPTDTRVMIFSSFRDSVQEIAEMLSQHQPAIRVMTFLGHSTGKNTKGFTHKEQLEVVRRFREGGYNTLVSTCVGEEGLDIGEVDLVICFDAQNSPIRLVQRMGRTGRKRQGRIVVILAEGREERTYNQSQSNKRSIYKAISENKMLQFYQQSPRMIPEDINPEMHKMFITPAADEPDSLRPLFKERRSSSLLHKTLFPSISTGTKQADLHENWFLTSEEYEVWNRLYRLKESDGLKEPVLPRVHFETLENLEEAAESGVEGARELSLSEWRLWQNRPFPTHLVDHSDRCHHFISVMEMIEMMRHEEGDCSYELELQPYLQIEDVICSDAQKSKSLSTSDSVLAQKAHASRKSVVHASKTKPFPPSINEMDSECISLFKTTNCKSTRRTSAFHLEVSAGTNTILDSFTVGGDPGVEHTDQKTLPNEEMGKVTFDLNGFIASNDFGENITSHESAGILEHKSEDRACNVLERNGADSGYGSITHDESSVSSDLFYLPEAELDSCSFTTPSEDPSWVKAMLANVQRLLSQSPPPLNTLDDFERWEETREDELCFQKGISHAPTETVQDKTAFPEVQSSLLSPERVSELKTPRKLRSSRNNSSSENSCFSEACINKTIDNLSWDDVFGDKDAHIQVLKEDLTKSPSDERLAEGYKENAENQKNVPSVHEESINLFEDEDISEAHFSPNFQLLEGSELCDEVTKPVAAQGSEWRMPDECCPGGDTNHGESLSSCRIENLKASEDCLSEQFLDNEDPYDCSQELFSVNFDLGFSVQESEDELSVEADMNACIQNPGEVSDSRTDVKPIEDENELLNGSSGPLSPPESKDESCGRKNFSTPQGQGSGSAKMTENCIPMVSSLNSTAKKTFVSPNSLVLTPSVPTGRRVVGVRPPRRILANGFSRVGQEIPLMQGTNKVNIRCVKLFPNSAFATSDLPDLPLGKAKNPEPTKLPISGAFPTEGSSSESEEEIVFQRKNKKKGNVLNSPDVMSNSDLESPIHAVKKRRHALNISDLSTDEGMDFHEKSIGTMDFNLRSCNKKQLKGVKRKKTENTRMLKNAARQFLDDEAELSQEDAEDVSPDESIDSENDPNSSLNQFLDDEAEITQALNDSEMQGVYLKSVRSPALGNRYKMVHKGRSNMAVFSQIPEQDETYLEDSFCVEEEEEESYRKSDSGEDEVCVNFDFLKDESCVSGRKQYLTRRRRKLNQDRTEQNRALPLAKKKTSRIIIPDDSSEEETNLSNARAVEADPLRTEQDNAHLPRPLPPDSSLHFMVAARDVPVCQSLDSKAQTLLDLKAAVSEELDFQPGSRGRARPSLTPTDSLKGKGSLQPQLEVERSSNNFRTNTFDAGQSTSKGKSSAAMPASSRLLETEAPLCILVDSREISSGSEIISSLKAVHEIKVQVCSLGGCDYIVSNRLVVERKFQSELLNNTNRSKLIQRIQHLQSMFERICVIVEKDRIKAGEALRQLHRTKHYDGMLSAFARAGIRILFSSCQEETAKLLKDLALVERRKKAAIAVPPEVSSPKQDALRFYLSIPNISHLTALNMCHRFGSVKMMANSSPKDIAAGAQVSQQKAEEIYRYIRYGFDPQMLPENLNTNGKSSTSMAKC